STLNGLSDKAHDLLNIGDIDGCILTISNDLKALPKTQYHQILDLEFTNSPATLGKKISDFIIENDCKAVLLDFYHFWDINIHGFDKLGDTTFYWLCDHVYGLHDVRLQGIEIFEDHFGNGLISCTPEEEASQDICGCLIVLKFFKLIHKCLPYISNQEIPIIGFNHDFPDSFIYYGDKSKLIPYDDAYHKKLEQERLEQDRIAAQEKQDHIDYFYKTLKHAEVFCWARGPIKMNFPDKQYIPDFFIQGEPINPNSYSDSKLIFRL
ncbi:MAG: hypothetical protein HRT90_07695, partial [Candidatus Margulisbacteria bacterium]|nr:hypothetical protein [Candidatus Margulisiibacteriota bacterium]